MFNLRLYLDKISNLNYVIIKYDVPYQTENFPDTYPIGKDLDILTTDFDKLLKFTTNFIKWTKIIKKKNNVRFRLDGSKSVNGKNKLHYQIDITFDNIYPKYKIKKDNFYILPDNKEYEIRKNLQKPHHIEWCRNYCQLNSVNK